MSASGSTDAPAAAPPEEERVAFPSRRGARLVGLHRPAAPGAPAVILCHGMESTKEGTKHRLLSERLGALGFACLRFDFSYVGESEGDFADLTFAGEVEDLGGAWDFVRGRSPGPVGLVGSSFGGAVAILFAAREPGVAALATIAAVGRPERIIAEVRPDERERWRREGELPLGGGRLRSTFLEDVLATDVLGACGRVACPTLVAHGGADRVVPVGEAEEIAAALGPRARLRITPEADHRYSDPAHLEALLEDCVAWMAHHLGAAPVPAPGRRARREERERPPRAARRGGGRRRGGAG